MGADWNKIKTEYITTNCSYRSLAEKYGISRVQIGNVGKKEGWVELRSQFLAETLTKTIEAVGDQEVDRAKKIQDVADKLLKKIETVVDAAEPSGMNAKAIRALTAAVKDLKEIQGIRSVLDEEEQRVRIENLRKQSQKDDKAKAITVVLEGELQKYAQ